MRNTSESQDRASNITVDARPRPLSLDISKAATIVVDMQNDFGTPGGMFDRAGLDVTQIQKVVPPTERLLAATRRADIPTIYLKMAYSGDLSDMGAPASPNRNQHEFLNVGQDVTSPDGQQSRILVRDTWNTEIVDELRPRPGDRVIHKTRFSGFYETELDAVLKEMGVTFLIVAGCTTSVCVESTIRDAMFRDYSAVLAADCANEFPRESHDASLDIIQARFGWVSSSEQLIVALKALKPAAASAT